MKRTIWTNRVALAALVLGLGLPGLNVKGADQDIKITAPGYGLGFEPPVLVALSGFTGEASEVIRFDLYVQGFAFTNSEAAQYLLSGSNNGDLRGTAQDLVSKEVKLSRVYTGATPRRQAHTFVDDFLHAIGRVGIGHTEIAFKGEVGGAGEIYIADFDGHNAQAITADHEIVAAPCWVPGQRVLYYTSYLGHHPGIYRQNVVTGQRRVFARYGGANISPAASPDGSYVAMILSKDGWTDLYVGANDGSTPLRLTKSPQDESSPCWSPDGKWICYASKESERRSLSMVSPHGGKPQRIDTHGISNPSEPDWSPDGKFIAFTSQSGGYFTIYVVPAPGQKGDAVKLVEGEDPSWAPNSRTLIFARRALGRGNYTLSLLDVGTKQVRDIARVPGVSSQSQPSWAR